MDRKNGLDTPLACEHLIFCAMVETLRPAGVNTFHGLAALLWVGDWFEQICYEKPFARNR